MQGVLLHRSSPAVPSGTLSQTLHHTFVKVWIEQGKHHQKCTPEKTYQEHLASAETRHAFSNNSPSHFRESLNRERITSSEMHTMNKRITLSITTTQLASSLSFARAETILRAEADFLCHRYLPSKQCFCKTVSNKLVHLCWRGSYFKKLMLITVKTIHFHTSVINILFHLCWIHWFSKNLSNLNQLSRVLGSGVAGLQESRKSSRRES